MLLPQEILDHVVDCLSTSPKEEASQKSLQTCLLVSRSMYLRARYHVFSKVAVIDNKSDSETTETRRKLKALRQLIEHKYTSSTTGDGFAPLVTCFTSFTIQLRNKQRTVYNVLDHEDFVAIMGHLHSPIHGVRRFVFDIWHAITFTGFSDEFKTAFRNLCWSPHLKALELTSIYHVPGDIISPPQLESLQVKSLSQVVRPPSDLFWRDSLPESDLDLGGIMEDDYGESQDIQPPMLRRIAKLPALISYDTDLTFHFPAEWVVNCNPEHKSYPLSPFLHLRRLSIVVDFTSALDIADLCAVIGVAHTSLQDLDIRIKFCPGRNTSQVLNVAPFSRLRHLINLKFHLHSHIYPHGWCPIDLTSVSSVLEAFSPPPLSMKRVDVILDLYAHGTNNIPRMFEPQRAEWLSLDGALSSTTLSSVKRLKLVVRPHIAMNLRDNHPVDDVGEADSAAQMPTRNTPVELKSKIEADYRDLIRPLIQKTRLDARFTLLVKSTILRSVS